MAKIEEMCQKSAFLLVQDLQIFWVPPARGCFCEQILDMTTRFKFPIPFVYMLTIPSLSFFGKIFIGDVTVIITVFVTVVPNKI